MKTAIITGASGGIGSSVVEGLKANNYVVHEVTSSNCNIIDNIQINNFLASIPKVDVLVNCAGVSHLGYIESLTEENLKHCYDVNVIGTFNFCKAVLPIMKKQRKGYIIIIGSLRGVECCPGKGSYSMSKFAIRAFSNTLCQETRSYGIKVTCINPGFVYTNLIEKRINSEKLKPSDILIPSDISNTVLFLLGLSEGAYVPEINLGEVWQ
nr:SDR family oxidoreductase [uncultured Methanospirillum sp.]